MFFRRLLSGITKTTVHLFGLVAIAGVWDYTQQAKAAEYDYAFENYPPSVMARYGDEIGYMSGALASGFQTVNSGLLEVITTSGLLEKVGLELDKVVLAEAEAGTPEPEVVRIATLETTLAPQTSLLPRARATH